MGGCQMTCPDLPCQHLLCCRGPPVQQRHSYQSLGFRFLLITFGAGKRHPSINVNPCNWRNMLIPHWVGLVDGWTDPSVTTGMFGIYKHAVRSRRWAARFTAAVKPLFYLERSTKERQEEDGIPVCVFTDLFKPSGSEGGGDRWSGSSTDNKAQPALVCLIGLQRRHLNKTKWLLLFPLGCQDRRQRPAKSAAARRGTWRECPY